MTCVECGREISEWMDSVNCRNCKDDICEDCETKCALHLPNGPFSKFVYECKKCKAKRLDDERKARGEWTAAELEEQGQLTIFSAPQRSTVEEF